MIRSMTGFASISREEGGRKVSITAKSVNHRFLDVQVKAPSALGAIEGRVKSLVQQRLTRGRLELAISLDSADAASYTVALNEALLERVAAVVDQARERGLLEGKLTTSDVLRLPQMLDIRHDTGAASALSEEAAALVENVLGDALAALVAMRTTEGEFLRRDLDGRVEMLSDLISDVESEARAAQVSLETRLRERIATLPSDLQGDPVALAQEIVRIAARSDIDEELVRFRGHVSHWRGLVEGPEPCGRKLDFLVQEMNREINTIGSKAEGTRVPELVVTAKAELERVREQVQNVE
jgi:uncharacterized protein (TIGR00255 family)